MSLGPQDNNGASGPCLNMASFLHDRAFSWYLQMAWPIVFTNSGFWKYSWAHLVMSMTESCWWVMQCRLRAQRPRPCPLCTEMYPVSLNLLMMLCTIDDEICTADDETLRNVVFKVFHNLFKHSFTDWRLLCHLYFWETLPLQDIFFYSYISFIANYVTDLTSNQLVAWCSPSLIVSKYLAQLFWNL